MSLIVTIKVFPSSGRNAWILDRAGILKCYLKSQPIKNKANQELILFLAASLALPHKKITLLRGETSRLKKIMISSPLTYSDFLRSLGLQQGDQRALF